MTYYAFPGCIDKKYIPAQMTHEIRVQFAKQIVKTVAIFYNVSIEAMQGKTRTKDLMRACQVSTYLIRAKIQDLSLKEVSAIFGNRYLGANGHDHSAIVHNMAKINDYLSIGDSIAQDIEQLKKLI